MKTAIVALSLALVAGAPASASRQAPASVSVAPPRDRAPSAQTGSAVIRGRIVGADTGKPLRRVKVRLSGAELGRDERMVSTDADGRYEISDLPAGRFTLSAERRGYLPLRYGQRRSFEAGRPLQVADGQILDDVDLSLIRMGVISGRVSDELGEPLAGALVFALRSQYFNGRRQWSVSAPAAITDDEGEYRIGGLAPSTYIVMSRTNARWTADEGGREQSMGFAPTYFGGTTNAAEARRVVVGSGKEAGSSDISLVPGRAVTVSGTALDSRGQPVKLVVLSQETLGLGGGIVGPAGNASTSADGTFTVRDVPPGDYKLQAAGVGEEATLPIVVNGVDIQNVSLVTAAGWSISGSVTTDAGVPPPFPRARLRLRERRLAGFNGLFLQGGMRGQQTLNEDWTFSVTGILGPARLGVVVPDGWAVKALLYDGRDIADTPMEPPGGGALSAVQLVLTDRVTRLTGQVVDGRGKALTDGTVLVFAADPTKWFGESRHVQAVRVDQKGTYRITGLPPGEYLAIAIDDVERDAWNDPEYLDSLRDRAQKLRLEDGESRTLPLKLVSP